jgi:hypothetical protein
MSNIRKIPLAAVTNATWAAVWEKAGAGSHTRTAVTLLDAGGEPSKDGKLDLNGCVLIENAYTEVTLYLLDTGELVELVEDPADADPNPQ